MSFVPCLLERWGGGFDGAGPRVLESSWDSVRNDVIRNLEWLLNTEALHYDVRPRERDGLAWLPAFPGPEDGAGGAVAPGGDASGAADQDAATAGDPRTELPVPTGASRLPENVRSSVVCFGIPAYSGRPQSTLSPQQMAKQIEERIRWFEPRLEGVKVQPLKDEFKGLFNSFTFEVEGRLLAEPLQSFLVHTRIDMEDGQATWVVRPMQPT